MLFSSDTHIPSRNYQKLVFETHLDPLVLKFQMSFGLIDDFLHLCPGIRHLLTQIFRSSSIKICLQSLVWEWSTSDCFKRVKMCLRFLSSWHPLVTVCSLLLFFMSSIACLRSSFCLLTVFTELSRSCWQVSVRCCKVLAALIASSHSMFNLDVGVWTTFWIESSRVAYSTLRLAVYHAHGIHAGVTFSLSRVSFNLALCSTFSCLRSSKAHWWSLSLYSSASLPKSSSRWRASRCCSKTLSVSITLSLSLFAIVVVFWTRSSSQEVYEFQLLVW